MKLSSVNQNIFCIISGKVFFTGTESARSRYDNEDTGLLWGVYILLGHASQGIMRMI